MFIHGTKDLLVDNLGVLGCHFDERKPVGLFVLVVTAVERGIPVVAGYESVSIIFGSSTVGVMRKSEDFHHFLELRRVDRALIADLHACRNAA